MNYTASSLLIGAVLLMIAGALAVNAPTYVPIARVDLSLAEASLKHATINALVGYVNGKYTNVNTALSQNLNVLDRRFVPWSSYIIQSYSPTSTSSYWSEASLSIKYTMSVGGRSVDYACTVRLSGSVVSMSREGHFSFLDMLTVREPGISPVLELIIGKVAELGAKRLVIDSFSAMAQAFERPHDARIVLHTILSRVARSMGCTTLLIVEVPHGRSEIGLGIEEFVADGIIVLRRGLLEGNPLRELEILKIRGSPTPRAHVVFTLKGGLRVFSGFKARPVEKPSKFKPHPDMKDRFSTGSPDLDEILSGGYPKGSTILFEVGEGVLPEHYLLAILPTIWNFMAHGRSVLITPSIGVEYSLIKERSEGSGFTSEEIDRLLRMYTRYRPDIRPGPGVVTFKGEDIFEDSGKRLKLVQELMDRTGQPVLDVNGVDALVDAYGVSGALSYLKACITTARIAGGLCLIVLKPGYPRLASILASMADVHLRFVRRHGAILVYGVNPATNLHVLEVDVSEGYPMPRLTPII